MRRRITEAGSPARRWTVCWVLLLAVAFTGCGLEAPHFAGYDLPPEEQRYTLTLDQEGTHTSWTFLSSSVTRNQRPTGTVCAEEIHAAWMSELAPPCRAEPLIFLGYRADVGLDNAVEANRVHRFVVDVRRQGQDPPRLGGLRVWVTTDAGTSWDPATVARLGNRDRFAVSTRYPRYAATKGSVGLRAVAWDVAGNRVEQVVDLAWFLRDSR